jgi:hypothetical protein
MFTLAPASIFTSPSIPLLPGMTKRGLEVKILAPIPATQEAHLGTSVPFASAGALHP